MNSFLLSNSGRKTISYFQLWTKDRFLLYIVGWKTLLSSNYGQNTVPFHPTLDKRKLNETLKKQTVWQPKSSEFYAVVDIDISFRICKYMQKRLFCRKFANIRKYYIFGTHEEISVKCLHGRINILNQH